MYISAGYKETCFFYKSSSRQGSTMFIQREVFVHVDITEGLFEEVLDINIVKLCLMAYVREYPHKIWSYSLIWYSTSILGS